MGCIMSRFIADWCTTGVSSEVYTHLQISRSGLWAFMYVLSTDGRSRLALFKAIIFLSFPGEAAVVIA